MTEKPSPTFTVRPTKELLPKLQQLALDTGKSEGQLLAESASIIIEMIESGTDFVPSLVRATRILRENATALSEGKTLLGGSRPSDRNPAQILPSETVRGLAPHLRLLPVFKYLPRSMEEVTDSSHAEWIAIPNDKAKTTELALKITPDSVDVYSPTLDYIDGDILLLTHIEHEDLFTSIKHLYLRAPAVLAASYKDLTIVGPGTKWPGHDEVFFRITESWPKRKVSENGPPINLATEGGRVNIPLKDCSSIFVVHQKLDIPRKGN